MGSRGSKPVSDEPLCLCKERLQQIKSAIDARNALAAAHLSYTQSLQGVGTALRRFAEAELSPESLLAMSDMDKSPAHSSFASLSPCRLADPGNPASALSPPSLPTASYMKFSGSSAVTVTVDPSDMDNAGQESPNLLRPPPPPPPPELCPSWDFFDSANATSRGEEGLSLNFGRLKGLRQSREGEVAPTLIEKEEDESHERNNACHSNAEDHDIKFNRSAEVMTEKNVCSDMEDAAEFITHRAKELLPSMKDIENRFHKASEAGNDVSNLLETKKIKLDICASSLTGKPSSSMFLVAFHLACCNKVAVLNRGTAQQAAKIITWKRSVSSMSSPTRQHPLAPATRHDSGDPDGEFIGQCAMVSGSHSSTLDRLHAWEKKLFDEIKASEYIRNAYDDKCKVLRSQFAQDADARVVDKTRAAVKDLHSRVCVAIQAVDSISRRIEKLRDEELQPQLVELIQGFIRMWKAMLKCHHAQYITISLAYHAKATAFAVRSPPRARMEALLRLSSELDCFASSFTGRLAAERSYIDALDAWLKKCVLQPQELRRGRRRAVFPPRQAILPPIFVLCSEWAGRLKSLPTEELAESIKSIAALLCDSSEQRAGASTAASGIIEAAGQETPALQEGDTALVGMGELKPGLSKMLDCLTKYAEASLKLYEELNRQFETACGMYRTPASPGVH